ncbi:MAG: hypothetical protein WA324_15880, partial [Bryobacteraceae bacterium]
MRLVSSGLAAFALLVFVAALSGQPAQVRLASQPARSSPEWLKAGVMYQIFPRSFSAEGDLDG